MDDLRYPIGEFSLTSTITTPDRARWIDDVARTPEHLRTAVAGLSAKQFDEPYRPDGWTVHQVVHHVADSHLHAFARFKLALTENTPTVKPYDEARWATLADVTNVDPAVSLTLIDALHRRWATLLRSMTDADFQRAFFHPEFGRALVLQESLARYAWHGRHHVAHITALRRRRGWE